MKLDKYPFTVSSRFFTEKAFDDMFAYRIDGTISLKPFILDKKKLEDNYLFERMHHISQVFPHFGKLKLTTRFSHTQLVVAISRYISDVLGLNTDLCVAIATAHDMMYPPYAHEGESIISKILGVEEKIRHEQLAVAFFQLIEKMNLTTQVLNGVLHHSIGTIDKVLKQSLPLEYLVVTWADKIAYLCSDIDDVLIMKSKFSQESIAEFIKLANQIGLNFDERLSNCLNAFVEESVETGVVGFSAKKEFGAKFLNFRTWMYNNIYHVINRKEHTDRIEVVYDFISDFIFSNGYNDQYDPAMIVIPMSETDTLLMEKKFVLPNKKPKNIKELQNNITYPFLGKIEGVRIGDLLNYSIDE